MEIAQRMARLGTETAFEVLAKAKALEAKGVDVVHLEIGEPDFDTPQHIRDAAVEALRQGFTHYCPSPGIPELRQAIAQDVAKTRGIEVDPGNVIVTPGAKPIMFYIMFVLVNEGDEVIYPNPGFPIYESMIKFVGGTPVPIALREERQFRFDVEELRSKITPKTKMIIINSPHNPTGGMLSKSDLEAIADMVKGRDIMVFTDEVYRCIFYEGEFNSIASLPGMRDKSIILDGFSKTYAMTGWRMGYAVVPPFLVEPITRLIINSVSCTSVFSQRACVFALNGPQDSITQMVSEFRKRRDFIVKGLNEIPGIRCPEPQGALYVFPNISGTGMTSREFETFSLNEAGVAVLSGSAFGQYGEGYARFSYANSIQNIAKALERIRGALAKQGIFAKM